MTDGCKTGAEKLAEGIRQRAFNLMFSGRMMCSESVLTALNQGLCGGLTPELALKVAAGFPEGIGGSGCTCGALTGGVIALGLFLSQSHSTHAGRRKVMAACGSLHHDFKSRFGSTCCRVLVKNGSSEPTRHFKVCCDRSGWAAEHAAGMILTDRPELVFSADLQYLSKKDSRFKVGLKNFFFGFFSLLSYK